MEQQTVVAVFDRHGEAQEALDALLENGFSRDQARLGSADSMASETRSESRSSTHQSLGQKIAHFFGLDDEDATATYSEAMRRGSSVVVVDADSEEEAQRATNILGRFDPIDIDQRVSEWEAAGWQRPAMEANQASRTAEQSTIPVRRSRSRMNRRPGRATSGIA